MFCKVKDLSDIDIVSFKKNLSKSSTKIDQDKFLLNFLSISDPKRKNWRKEKNQRNTKDRLVIKYVIPWHDSSVFKTVYFHYIQLYSRNCLNLLAFNFNKNHDSPKEKREGKSANQDSIDTTESIRSHIMT